MLRCVPFARRFISALALGAAVLAAAAVADPAQAQQRSFPATALRGELTVLQPPEVLLNGRPARLSPGARIRGENNLMMVSGALANQRAKDIIDTPDQTVHAELVANLREHTVYIIVVAMLVGVVLSRLLANSVASRVGLILEAMKLVQQGQLNQRVQATGNDEIDGGSGVDTARYHGSITARGVPLGAPMPNQAEAS